MADLISTIHSDTTLKIAKCGIGTLWPMGKNMQLYPLKKNWYVVFENNNNNNNNNKKTKQSRTRTKKKTMVNG